MARPTKALPLVSVGIPAFGRPEGLKKTLLCIAGQTYTNLDIVVSDNASPDPEGIRFARELAKNDSRIRIFVQKTNTGPLANFEFVLSKSIGKYFMWAADDDDWQEWFIERCVSALEQIGPTAAAAVTEVQYFSEAGLCDFFFEGAAFHDRIGLGLRERLELMLDQNYGNLFYSLFRREALFLNEVPLFSALQLRSLNEIPILLQVAACGDWIVIPEIGMRKRTRMPTYRQARWEREGGRLPKECRATTLASIRDLYRYHQSALSEITKSIRGLEISTRDAQALEHRAKSNLWMHFLFLAAGVRPRK